MNYERMISPLSKALQPPALRQITLEVQKINGVNLGQGTCQLPPPPYIVEQAHQASLDGINRYTPPRGLQSLREAVAKKLEAFNGIHADPETEILITCGATGAFEAVCAVLLNPGDEVVTFEPTYPYHVQGVQRHRGKLNYVSLHLQGDRWTFDPDELRRAITPNTKFLILNTPANPTGKVFAREELETVAQILEGTETMLVTDEIYEYMVFDGREHISPATLPSLKARTITIGGYSKTFSITGWRIGYCVAPAALATPMAQVLDRIYVCAPAPLQEGVARGVQKFDPSFYQELNAKYERKRNFFVEGLREIGLTPLPPEGAYYMIVRFDELFPGMSSWDFARKLVETCGVGTVPAQDFMRDPSASPWVRFCLAVEDDVLEEALNRMQALKLVGAPS